MLAWNFHPETRKPILTFEDLKVPTEILDRLGLEPKENGIFILTNGDSKRTEYFNVLVTPVLNELEALDYTSGFGFYILPVYDSKHFRNPYKARHNRTTK